MVLRLMPGGGVVSDAREELHHLGPRGANFGRRKPKDAWLCGRHARIVQGVLGPASKASTGWKHVQGADANVGLRSRPPRAKRRRVVVSPGEADGVAPPARHHVAAEVAAVHQLLRVLALLERRGRR